MDIKNPFPCQSCGKCFSPKPGLCMLNKKEPVEIFIKGEIYENAPSETSSLYCSEDTFVNVKEENEELSDEYETMSFEISALDDRLISDEHKKLEEVDIKSELLENIFVETSSCYSKDDDINKSFPCTSCGKCFANPSGLSRHKKEHLEGFQPRKKCRNCGKRYRKDYFKRHLQACNAKQTSFQCNICGKLFEKAWKLTKHTSNHKRKEVKCKFCDKRLSSGALKRHIERIHTIAGPDGSLIVKSKKSNPHCKLCHKKFARKSNYYRHMRSQHNGFDDINSNGHGCNGKESDVDIEDKKDIANYVIDYVLHEVTKSAFKCDLCNPSEEFDSRWELRMHRKQVHQKGECNICGKKIKGAIYNMRRHYANYHAEKPFKKEKENYSLSQLYRQAKRIREIIKQEDISLSEDNDSEAKMKLTEVYRKIIKLKHNENKTLNANSIDEITIYFCDKCDKKYTSSKSLSRHKEVTHERIRYPCDQCDYKAKDLNQLELHIGSVHEHSVSCDMCDKKYTHQKALRRHKASEHEGVRYPCEQCDYKAKDKSTLRKHTDSIHEKIAAPCDMCDKVYTHPRNLRQHKASVHEGIFYLCDQCDYKATQKRHLNSHIEKHHSI